MKQFVRLAILGKNSGRFHLKKLVNCHNRLVCS